MTQQNSNVLVWAGIVLAIVLSVAGFFYHSGSSSPAVGSTTQTGLPSYAPVNATSFVGPYGVESDQGFFDAAGGTSALLGSLSFGSNPLFAGFLIQGYAGSCANAASSTLFAIKTTATTTYQVWIPAIGGNATTSSLLVGTSTTPNGSTSISATLISSTNGIATSTVQGAYSGQTDVPNGFISAGAGSSKSIIAIPGQYLVGFSTSTALGSGAQGYSPNFSTCSYQVKSEN